MTKKLAFLTGATDGVGRHVALGLAKANFDLIFVARNPAKANKLLEEIRSINPDTAATLLTADLTLVAEAKKVAENLKQVTNSIDVLYQSAGIIPNKLKLTNEGIEESFAVSFLTRYVLINELLPLVLQSEEKKILTVASPFDQAGPPHIRFDDINRTTMKFSANDRVRQFQEANEVLSVELDETYRQHGLKNFCINPGIVNTGIHNGWPPLIRFLLTKIIGPFMMIQPEPSAQLPLNLALNVSGEQGPLISHKGKSIKIHIRYLDTQYRKRLFDLCNDLAQLGRESKF
jgi:NAD(P)-dependent dehydrogenase (short-subunit alcohol dehydrogenase family)